MNTKVHIYRELRKRYNNFNGDMNSFIELTNEDLRAWLNE